jgi:acetyl esterase/lipase
MYKLDAREIPLPSSASTQVQDAIAAKPAPDVDAWKQTVPQDEAGWIDLIALLDKTSEAPFVTALVASQKVVIQPEQIAGVGVYRINPAKVKPSHEGHLFVNVHGGAYVLGAGRAGLAEGILLAYELGMPVLAIDYRMPPKHPFPAGLDDVIAVYTRLLQERPADSIVMGGTSAGAGLALAAIHRFKELELDLPGAMFAGTPWTDLTKTGDSYFINEGLDRILVSYEGVLEGAARLYADGNDLRDPLLSPIYGCFDGFPPTFLITGTRDLFFSCTVRAHSKLRAACVPADLLVFEGHSHGDYVALHDSPEAKLYYEELHQFLERYLQ